MPWIRRLVNIRRNAGLKTWQQVMESKELCLDHHSLPTLPQDYD
jgi:hypothetical protein